MPGHYQGDAAWALRQVEQVRRLPTKAPQSTAGAGEISREIWLDGPAPTLVSSYRCATSITTRFVYEEADGTRRERPRFLSPRECARLMGFPDSYRYDLPPHVRLRATFSESDIYHQLGNAVCPPVIAAIVERMLLVMGTS